MLYIYIFTFRQYLAFQVLDFIVMKTKTHSDGRLKNKQNLKEYLGVVSTRSSNQNPQYAV